MDLGLKREAGWVVVPFFVSLVSWFGEDVGLALSFYLLLGQLMGVRADRWFKGALLGSCLVHLVLDVFQSLLTLLLLKSHHLLARKLLARLNINLFCQPLFTESKS